MERRKLMTMLEPGEKVHVIERRTFEHDVRRHFVGEVERATDAVARATGYTFVANMMTGVFERREPPRTRIIPLAATGLVVYVIPEDVDIKSIRYEWTAGNKLLVRGGSWEVVLDEFAVSR